MWKIGEKFLKIGMTVTDKNELRERKRQNKPKKGVNFFDNSIAFDILRLDFVVVTPGCVPASIFFTTIMCSVK